MGKALRSEIEAIKIIDHHSHCIDEFYWKDATNGPSPFPQMNDFPVPGMSLAKTNRLLSMMCKMYERPFPKTEEEKAELRNVYETSLADEAALYSRMLDLAGIELVGTLGQHKPVLPPGLDPKRFLPLSLSDGLLVPLDNSGMKKFGPKCEVFLRMAECSLELLKKELNNHPANFDEYLRLVSASVRWYRDQGAISLKSSCGYWRGLDFDIVDENEARTTYNAGDNSPAKYKRLQDFLQIYILRECAAIGLPFQMHTGPVGQEGFGALANPGQLDKLIYHANTKCTFILLHGGFPFCSEAGALVAGFGKAPQPVYLDTSAMWMVDPMPGASFNRRALREWVEWGIAPKLIYGSDGVSVFSQWLSAYSFREDLIVILDDLVENSLLSVDQALEAAYLILRGNSERIYSLIA